MFPSILKNFRAKISNSDKVNSIEQLKHEFDEKGLVVIENAISDDCITNHIETVKSVRDKLDTKDVYGFGDRIGQLHQAHNSLISTIAHCPVVHNLLSYALKDEPLLFGSLNFEKGTEQKLHVDAIFFWPQPQYSMAGVWVALEDVTLDNGPLIYIPGSHRYPMILSDEIVKDNPKMFQKREAARSGLLKEEKLAAFITEMGELWTQKYYQLVDERGGKVQRITVKKGSIILWHSLLAHGGDLILNKKLSRWSVVYHFLGKKSLLFSFEKFMLSNSNEFSEENAENLEISHFDSVDYIKYPYFVTYNNGEQIVHHL